MDAPTSPPIKRQRLLPSGRMAYASHAPDPVARPELCLSDEQRWVVDALAAGRNVYVNGCAGTGKSHLLRYVRARPPVDDPATVFITASTGIAAVQIGGSTVHGFAGVRDGVESAGALIAAVRRSPRAVARWRVCRLLIVDEISMISADLLDKLDAVGRAVRGVPDQAFGGVQLLLLGDFLQLPPVGAAATAAFAFDAPAWSALRLRTVTLTRVFRQHNAEFIALLAEVRVGRLGSAGAAALMGRVGARPAPGVVPTKLRATNREVDEENLRAYRRLCGPSRDYVAVDDCTDPRELAALQRSCPAPATVFLKVGAAVLLLKNLDVANGLVNGSQGTVVALDPEGPVVRFNGIERPVRPVEWTVEIGGSVRARRKQVPLRLAYAITIHKSQGMQLQHVDVSTAGVFEYGQLYVALSRATDLAGVYLQRFEPEKARAHPRVLAFYAATESR